MTGPAESRYHVSIALATLPFAPPARFHLQDNDEYVKYGHPPFATPGRGDPYWTPEIISQTWYMAEKGKIPISGAGYGGPFAGPGFDAIWLDMSEIVRPTRDGIHGREYISTGVDLGRKPARLVLDAAGRLTASPPIVELPIPVVFNPFPFPLQGRAPVAAIARAAAALRTLAIVTPEQWGDDLIPLAEWIAPRLRVEEVDTHRAMWAAARYVELEVPDTGIDVAGLIKGERPDVVIGYRIPLEGDVETRVLDLAAGGAEVVHLYADEYGSSARGFIADTVRGVHRRLVDAGIRDEVTLLASGGIATAEHVPKAIVCGADLVAIDYTILLAFGCGLWADKAHCPAESGDFSPEWGAQRLVNLMGAWRDQLLECLGAMGMREVRRLRGETGRAIFQPQEEAAFRALIPTTAPAPPEPEDTEVPTMGDLRWTPDLLQATWVQAATGHPPTRGEYRVGKSGGGFDVVRFAVELDGESESGIRPEEVDISLRLNRRGDGPQITIDVPFYGGGMSFGSVSAQTMLARAMAAAATNTFTSTGEGGYPEELVPYANYVITQVATGLFGVREETIQRARFVEFKYAQGAKPGLGGHLLGGKTTEVVATMREAVAWTSLFSPFPFHSVYSVEDHKKHVDWIRAVHPDALIAVKVSTPTDVDMVAVGIYYAGAHIVHLDGGYGGTGAAPEIAKKNIAMPIEYAIPKVHRFLVNEGIRDDIVLVASGGIRTAYDAAKAIALGADGVVVGMADLVAIGCTRLADCEKGKGCPFGITTTDPEMSKLIVPEWGAERIANLYRAWGTQLRELLAQLGMRRIGDLRGRTDLLVYLERSQ